MRTHRMSFRIASALATWLAILTIVPYLAVPRSALGAQFVVTTTADAGVGSLRQAIEDANNSLGYDPISFAIPGTGPHTISPLTALPGITEQVTIDGYTQPGASNTVRLIRLSGANLTSGAGLQFDMNAQFSVVRGLVVERFPGNGIYLLQAMGVVIDRNAIRSNSMAGVAMYSGISSLVTDNVITGNGKGMFLFGVSQANMILSNRIGIDETGAVRANGTGVEIECSGGGISDLPQNGNRVIGNMVVGNNGCGVIIREVGSTWNVVEGNSIFQNSGDGVLLFNGAAHSAVRFNRIACNGENGVHVAQSNTTAVVTRENSISHNGRLGIDLGGVCSQASCTDDGVTGNDAGDIDTGPNNLQNFPVLTSITESGGNATIQGMLNSIPNKTFRLEFFATRLPNAAGYIEGATFLGFTNATTSPSGSTNFAMTLPANVVAGHYITATATDPDSNTSEFSAALRASGEPTPSQQAYLKASNTGTNDSFGLTMALSGDTLVVGSPGEDSNATGVGGNQSDNTAASSGAAYIFVRCGPNWIQQAYLKASNSGAGDSFGGSVAISGDTVVVGASGESSSATGVNGNQNDNSAAASGAAYIFVRSGTTWSQQAYLKASNTGAVDGFGSTVAISGDTVVVGASGESSNATGVNGNQSDNSAASSGAAYVFVRTGTTWSQQAYLKASNTGEDDSFGWSVAVSADTAVVGAIGEASAAAGVNGNQSDNSASFSGAAYVFVRSGTTWSQQAYLKASNTGMFDYFGLSVAVLGETVVVSAPFEDSNATGVNGNQADNSADVSGAAYVFVRSGTTWSQQAYLKASNTGAGDSFGWSVAVSADTAVVGAISEASAAAGVNGNQADNSALGSGAAYVFVRTGTTWSQQAYLKASNVEASDRFGSSVAVSGGTVAAGASGEDSNATGVNGNQSDNSATDSGAAYLFTSLGIGPRLAIVRDGSGGYFIRVNGAPDVTYYLQRTSIVTGPWTNLTPLMVPSSGFVEYHDTNPLPGRAFYRALQP